MNIKIKSFIITIIVCIILYFAYTTTRDYYIIKQNENYEIKEYVINQEDLEKEQR